MMNEYRKTSELKEWKDNPRSITKQAFERLKKHITAHGQMQPLVITADGEVLGGNMRLKAYRELGIDEVWVKVVEPKDENDKLKIALVLNDRAGFYDDDLLANLLPNYDIDWSQYSVDLREPTNLQELLDQFLPVTEDEAPDVDTGPAISKTGDIYQLGRHRLMCGDATKIEDVEKLMNGQKADMVFTDPPYGIDLDTDYSKLKGSAKSPNAEGYKYRAVIGDNQPFNHSDFHWIDCVEQFWWGGDYYRETLPSGGSWFVWKKRPAGGEEMIGNDFELCWSKQKHKKQIIEMAWVGYLAKERNEKRTHPTQKPIELCVWFIKKFSEKDQKILDLFGGSGSTLIACEQTNRICYMAEISPAYCDVIRKRYSNFIGKGDSWQMETPKI